MTRFISSLPSWFILFVIIAGIIIVNYWYYGLILCVALYLAWVYSLGVESNLALSATSRRPLFTFRAALIYPGIYIAVAQMYPQLYHQPIKWVIMALHLLGMFCIFYVMYFVAKGIRSVELAREAKFEEYFAIFFGLWFVPIGAWFIQRKIQKIVAANTVSPQGIKET